MTGDGSVSKVRVVASILVATILMIVAGGLVYPQQLINDPSCDAKARNTNQCELVCYDRPFWWRWGTVTDCVWDKNATVEGDEA